LKSQRRLLRRQQLRPRVAATAYLRQPRRIHKELRTWQAARTPQSLCRLIELLK
jgi:hypothetical protein